MAPDFQIKRLQDQKEYATTRNSDTKTTHFTFGSDKEILRSEALHQFAGHQKMDANTPPAGKTEIIPEINFDHINISKNTQDFKPDPHYTSKQESIVLQQQYVSRAKVAPPVHQYSIMKADYLPLENRQ